MSDMGHTFREARERKQMTIAQAAEATCIKGAHLEAMERNRFDGFAAPIYARGFIRTYAEYLNLDPKPLLEEYQRQTVLPAEPPPIPLQVFKSSTAGPTPSERAEPLPEPEPLAPALDIPPLAAEPPTLELNLYPEPASSEVMPRVQTAAPEPEPAPRTEPLSARSFRPILYGALITLPIVFLLSRCAHREPPAAPPPRPSQPLLIEDPPEPFFPLRGETPAAQSTP
jgi:hypothetical protein